jgi:hypothetical protein
MKGFFLLTVEGLLFALAPVSRGLAYDASWFTIDGGGGTSSGGAYSITGTIGQPDAGAMSGGVYQMVGGFWGLVEIIQTPGAPLLSIERVGTAVRVFWPLPATDFVLDEATSLAGSPAILWNQTGFSYQTNATYIFVTLPAPAGSQFFRLRKP